LSLAHRDRRIAAGSLPPGARSTLATDVYEAIKGLLMDHVIAPGDKVNIDGLARELDVSPTPVREALARLESDGLVRKRPLSGYTVAPLLSREEFEHLFEMRQLLEPAAAARAAQRATAAEREAILAESQATTIPGPEAGYRGFAEFSARDARFHDLIADAAANDMLHDSITRLHSHLHLHRLYFPHGQAEDTLNEHVRIARAILRGEARAAGKAMREHIARSRRRHVAAFDAGLRP
jgi:DNA-binding GntR family transcriptional regulator